MISLLHLALLEDHLKTYLKALISPSHSSRKGILGHVKEQRQVCACRVLFFHLMAAF